MLYGIAKNTNKTFWKQPAIFYARNTYVKDICDPIGINPCSGWRLFEVGGKVKKISSLLSGMKIIF